ncbi:MAG: 50S ribosomal protein L6 [Caldilineales bacterium]|nr:50S ribosomal protein L6 [Caldilineales bacterium]MDW8316268.1 50S ribosomal protein L6 [Anaerolineae bacterium]
MSRIGKLPIAVPKNVSVTIQPDNTVIVKGPKGQLQKTFPRDMRIELADGQLRVYRPSDNRFHRMQHGLTRALLANMVQGVVSGFKRSLTIEGVGYRAEMQGPKLVLFMGYSHPVEMVPPPGITYSMDKSGRIITVEGIDKELVGLMAARIRAVRPPEPYHGKGLRYNEEVVRRKQGKTGK